MVEPYIINGALSSPYSVKMRALFRYRRIPHIWNPLTMANREETLAKVKAPVIPVIAYPDGSFHNDSTPMIIDLEAAHKDRSLVPDDEAQGFLAWLLEDMADEWGNKMMFHYRWYRPRDNELLSKWLVFDMGWLLSPGEEMLANSASFIRERQVGRMDLVGCTEQNRPLIEETAADLFDLLNDHLPNEPFFFGSRPSVADFGWFGQLSQLGTDPTSHEILRDKYPLTLRWTQNMDDLGGIEGNWRDPDKEPSDLILGLLKMAGDVYLPFLEANAKAFEREEASFSFHTRGHTYEQATFKYQVRCLAGLRTRFDNLSPGAKEKLRPLLKKTKCLGTFEEA